MNGETDLILVFTALTLRKAEQDLLQLAKELKDELKSF